MGYVHCKTREHVGAWEFRLNQQNQNGGCLAMSEANPVQSESNNNKNIKSEK